VDYRPENNSNGRQFSGNLKMPENSGYSIVQLFQKKTQQTFIAVV
jgi:hypothetical protein